VQRQRDEPRHIAGRDEVARLVAAAYELRTTAPQDSLAIELVHVPFHERGRSKHGVLETTALQALLNGKLGPKEVDRMIRCCAECRHVDESLHLCGHGCGNEVPVAEVVHMLRAIPAPADQRMRGCDHALCAIAGPRNARGIDQIPDMHFDSRCAQAVGSVFATRHDANAVSLGDQQADHFAAKDARGSDDESEHGPIVVPARLKVAGGSSGIRFLQDFAGTRRRSRTIFTANGFKGHAMTLHLRSAAAMTLLFAIAGCAGVQPARVDAMRFLAVVHATVGRVVVDASRCAESSHPLLMTLSGTAETVLGSALVQQSHCENRAHTSFSAGVQTFTFDQGTRLVGTYQGRLIATPTTEADKKLIIDGQYSNTGGSGAVSSSRGTGAFVGTVDVTTGAAVLAMSGVL